MAGPVSTYGWDVVFATRTSVVNAGLAEPGPQSLDETVQHGGVSVHAQGSTGRWQVAVGGSGALVNFTVPCATLTLGTANKKVELADGRFEIQGTLALTPAGPDDSGHRELTVVAGRGAVTVLTASFPQNGFAGYAAYAQSALQSWLDAQASFPYVLATVGLAPPEPTGLDQVLAPVTATYAYVDATAGDGVLGVLSTIAWTTTNAGQLLQEVSPDAVATADTAVLVSAEVMQHLVEGAVSAVTLPGSTGSTSPVDAPASFDVLRGSR